MEMTRDALEYITGLKDANGHIIDGVTYTDKAMFPVLEKKAGYFTTKTLSSLVDYIKGDIDAGVRRTPLIVHIKNHESVSIKSHIYDATKERDYFVEASAEIPEFPFGRFISAEEFNIAMQSKFIDNEDKEILLKVVGNLKDEAVRTMGDDGVSQSVTMKTGVSNVANVKVPNPVVLMPFRTFTEIEQPSSKFIFRMKDGGYCALFEADGGAWKNEARENIKNYLDSELKKAVENELVVILA